MKMTISNRGARAIAVFPSVAALATIVSCAQPHPRHDASADRCHPLAGAFVGGAVGAEYRELTNSELPATPMVTAYHTSSSPEQAHGGDEITVTSHLEIVPGRGEPLRELREEFAIVDPNGVVRSRIAKTPVPAGSQGGAFVSTLQFTIPTGVPDGSYQVQSQVFVNGKQVQKSVVNLMVARSGTEQNSVLKLATRDLSLEPLA